MGNAESVSVNGRNQISIAVLHLAHADDLLKSAYWQAKQVWTWTSERMAIASSESSQELVKAKEEVRRQEVSKSESREKLDPAQSQSKRLQHTHETHAKAIAQKRH